MADIHVGQVREIIFHFDVPGGTNDVGVAWSTALVNSGRGGTTRMVEGTGAGQITTAEKAQIEAGTRFEYSYPLKNRDMPNTMTQAQKLQLLRHYYAQALADQIDQLQVVLAFFGYTAAKE